jgi:hypothetical protein
MTIQFQIAELIRSTLTAQNNPLLSMVETLSTEDICKLIFYSFRGTDDNVKGLRLSNDGLILTKTCFKSYEFPEQGRGTRVKLPHLLYLDRISTFPYFINAKLFVTFDSELAMMLRLSDAKIETLIQAKYRLQFDKDAFLPDL